MNIHTSPLAGVSLRQPPAALDAEQALLGALLTNNRAYERVSDFLQPEHFADPVHARIFQVITRKIEAGGVADVVTIRRECEANGTLAELGGAAYLIQLLGATVGIINAGDYGRVVFDAWLRRNLIELGEGAVNLAFADESEGDARAVLDTVEAQLFALGEAAQGQGAGAVQPARAVVQGAMDQQRRAAESKGGIVGVTTGYRRLDRMTGGLRAGDLALLAARPSMGKTALGAGIAARAAAAGHRVLFVSAEMTAEAIGARIVAAQAKLPVMSMLQGAIVDPGTNDFRQLNASEAGELVQAGSRISALPLEFDARGAPTVASIRSRARRMARRGGLALIVIDYLGKLRASERARKQNRNVEVGEIAQDLKAMAMELRVPVLCLSQLSREVERRDDKTPQLSDLRDSGEIEQEADLVAFLYREHYYLSRNPPQRRDKEKAEDFDRRQDAWHEALARSAGMGELIIAKQRQGPTGRVPLRFVDRLTWFFDESEPEGGAAVPAGGMQQ